MICLCFFLLCMGLSLTAICATKKTPSIKIDTISINSIKKTLIPQKNLLMQSTADQRKQQLINQEEALILPVLPASILKAVKNKHPAAKEIKKEQTYLERLKLESSEIMKKLPVSDKMQRLSWKTLLYMVHKTGRDFGFSGSETDSALRWVLYMKEYSFRLGLLFDIPHTHHAVPKATMNSYIRLQNVLVTPGMASMWNHCVKNFQKQVPGWNAKLISAYRSPAYQLVLFSKTPGRLQDVITSTAPPYYSRHQLEIPDITVHITPEAGSSGPQPWQQFYDICQKYGFSQSFSDTPSLKGELMFPGIEHLYNDILEGELIPKKIGRDFLNAMHQTKFYPSPDGLRMIFALSAQESTIQWNPRLNIQKKQHLKEKYHSILSQIKGSFPEKMSSLILSKKHQQQLNLYSKELASITDLENIKVREYDFYLWSRKTYDLIRILLKEHQNIAKLGQWLFELESYKQQLEYEPQTFGLWQINANHLLERIESFPQLRRAFHELYQKKDGEWKVVREWLIDALSGLPTSRLSRAKTLELIIHTHLQPRYETHMLGEKDDLLYFAAENMSGEMSTFRAAVQQELNKKIGSHLICDGDLTFYYPYSTKINWSERSNTVNRLFQFIKKHQYYLKEPVIPQNLVNDLSMAKTWNELEKVELYKKIMGKKKGLRIFPDIKSSLYNQTPFEYSKTVLKKSGLF